MSSNVKQTLCGYSVSAMTTAPKLSFLTYTWHRYSEKKKKTKEQGVLLSEQFSPDLIVQENYCVYWCIEEGPKNKKTY